MAFVVLLLCCCLLVGIICAAGWNLATDDIDKRTLFTMPIASAMISQPPRLASMNTFSVKNNDEWHAKIRNILDIDPSSRKQKSFRGKRSSFHDKTGSIPNRRCSMQELSCKQLARQSRKAEEGRSFDERLRCRDRDAHSSDNFEGKKKASKELPLILFDDPQDEQSLKSSHKRKNSPAPTHSLGSSFFNDSFFDSQDKINSFFEEDKNKSCLSRYDASIDPSEWEDLPKAKSKSMDVSLDPYSFESSTESFHQSFEGGEYEDSSDEERFVKVNPCYVRDDPKFSSSCPVLEYEAKSKVKVCSYPKTVRNVLADEKEWDAYEDKKSHANYSRRTRCPVSALPLQSLEELNASCPVLHGDEKPAKSTEKNRLRQESKDVLQSPCSPKPQSKHSIAVQRRSSVGDVADPNLHKERRAYSRRRSETSFHVPQKKNQDEEQKKPEDERKSFKSFLAKRERRLSSSISDLKEGEKGIVEILADSLRSSLCDSLKPNLRSSWNLSMSFSEEKEEDADAGKSHRRPSTKKNKSRSLSRRLSTSISDLQGEEEEVGLNDSDGKDREGMSMKRSAKAAEAPKNDADHGKSFKSFLMQRQRRLSMNTSDSQTKEKEEVIAKKPSPRASNCDGFTDYNGSHHEAYQSFLRQRQRRLSVSCDDFESSEKNSKPRTKKISRRASDMGTHTSEDMLIISEKVRYQMRKSRRSSCNEVIDETVECSESESPPASYGGKRGGKSKRTVRRTRSSVV